MMYNDFEITNRLNEMIMTLKNIQGSMDNSQHYKEILILLSKAEDIIAIACNKLFETYNKDLLEIVNENIKEVSL